MSVIWEKSLWCRYFFPIGAMNNMFATLAMAEVRTWKANCDGCANPTCTLGKSPTLDPSYNSNQGLHNGSQEQPASGYGRLCNVYELH
jgi:polyferredoxin